ncbi:MAG: SLC13 family permease [Pirellulales bacterium]
MIWEAYFTLAVVVGILILLVRESLPTDIVMVSALVLLVAVGELRHSEHLPSIAQGVSGMGNTGLVTVGVLFVVVTGLVQTGAMELVAGPIIGQPKSATSALVRLLTPVTFLSAFLNNTPVVAMFMPVVEDICKRSRISPSKLYLPMAYAATFGGVCTLVGTSTNLIVQGLLHESGRPEMKMFDLTWVGIPCALAGVAFFLTLGKWLIPDRRPAVTTHTDPREYTAELVVLSDGPLVGKSIEEAGLRHLPGLFLARIDRFGEEITPVSPRERLLGGDRLVFAGVLDSVVDLTKMRGLARAPEHSPEIDTPVSKRRLIEAVVSSRCPLVGSSIRAGEFRSYYNAAVVAVARGGERVQGKIGDIVLEPGDTLLLETDEDFLLRQRNSSHFFLVSGVENSQPVRRDRAWVALGLLVAMVVVSALGWLDLLTAAFIAAGWMIALGCCSVSQARQSVDWSLLVVIAAALGIGKAIDMSGLADVTASQIIGYAGGHPWLVLVAVYFVAMIFTELITNNAAAVLVFPIAMSAADSLGVSTMPFVIAIAIGASAGFATPFGYQTNLMVYGPGGYRFTDYLKVGIPLDLVFMAVTVFLTPYVFPF